MEWTLTEYREAMLRWENRIFEECCNDGTHTNAELRWPPFPDGRKVITIRSYCDRPPEQP